MSITTRLARHLVSLATRRENGTVTADDAQRILDRWSYRGSRNIVGPVLRSHFRSTGFTRSKVDTNRSRTIRTWKYVA